MADDKKKRGGADRGLIALSEPYEVAYWSKKFKITPAKLKSAVKKAGRSAKNVEAYIKLQKHKASDRARIAMSQPYEVRYWSKKFKVTPARLKAAVAAVGHSSKSVGAYLAKRQGCQKKAKKSASKNFPGKPQRSAQRKRPPERRPPAHGFMSASSIAGTSSTRARWRPARRLITAGAAARRDRSVINAGRSDHFDALLGRVLRGGPLIRDAFGRNHHRLRHHHGAVLRRRAMGDDAAGRNHHGLLHRSGTAAARPAADTAAGRSRAAACSSHGSRRKRRSERLRRRARWQRRRQ